MKSKQLSTAKLSRALKRPRYFVIDLTKGDFVCTTTSLRLAKEYMNQKDMLIVKGQII